MSRNHKGFVTAFGALLMLSACCLPAMAALGGDLNSVQEDKTHMKATVQIKQGADYAVHEIKDTHGTIVREYVSPAGRVFGVAWQGPFMPDINQLMGTYFQQFSAAAQEDHQKRPGRHPLSLKQPGLVVETGGHMRAFYGRAYVPDMVPQQVNAGEIR